MHKTTKKTNNNASSSSGIGGAPVMTHGSLARFTPDGKLIVDQADIDAGLFKRAPPAAGEDASVVAATLASAMHEACNTRILTSEVKSVYTANLQTERCGVSKEVVADMERERCTDIITKILSHNPSDNAETARALNWFIEAGIDAMKEHGYYPGTNDRADAPDPRRRGEIGVVDSAVKRVLGQKQLVHKRAMIIIMLYICPQPTAIICPRDGNRRFATNPEMLNFFLRDEASPLPQLITNHMIGSLSTDVFVALVLKEWMMLRPWQDMERIWSKVRPNETSLGIKLLLNEEIPAAASQFISGYIVAGNAMHMNESGGAGNVGLIEYGDGDGE